MQFTPDVSGRFVKTTNTPKDKIKISFISHRKSSLVGSTFHKNSFIPEETDKEINESDTIIENANETNENQNNQELIDIDQLKKEKRVYEAPTYKKSSIGRTNKKFINFVTTLNEAIEQYQNDFLLCYGNVVFTSLVSKFKERLNTFYKKKIENFENYEDQVKELNMLLDGNENNEANNTINLMIENLLIEKSKIDDELLLEHENKIQEFIQEESNIDYYSSNEKFSRINNQIKAKIQEIVINNEISNK